MPVTIFALEHDPEPADELRTACAPYQIECHVFGPAELGRVAEEAKRSKPVAAIVDVSMFSDRTTTQHPRPLVCQLRDVSPGILIAAWTQTLSTRDPVDFSEQIRDWGVDDVIPKTRKGDRWDAGPVVAWLRKRLRL